jgi:hypothetical protein
MRRLLPCLIALVLLPAAGADAASCKRVNGKIGYYAKEIRAGAGARCAPARKKLKRWLDGPVVDRIAGPRGWSCTRRSSKRQIAYDCDPGTGRVRFVLRFSAA